MRPPGILPAFLFLLSAALAGAETIVIMGSDTIGGKMAVRLAEAFRGKAEAEGKSVAFEISSEGSATALASVMAGKADIGMVSYRPARKSLAEARKRGVRIRTIPVARDAIAIIVNAANPVDSIRLEDLERIYSGDATNWSAITAQHTGRISAYTRNTASGTYSVLQEVALGSRDYGDTTSKMAGNEQIASEVAANPSAIGYVGLAYAFTPGVKVLPVDGVAPGEPDYPLARTLSFIVDGNKPVPPAVNDFIGFTLSPEGQEIVRQARFLPLY